MSLAKGLSAQPIRVMVVDDSAFMRKAVERILLNSGDIVICESVSSGELALEKMDAARPDLITMDVEMPGMGGLNAVRAIMARRRLPIIMLSSLTARGTETTLQALENGAADFIAKPTGGAIDIGKIAAELIDKVHELTRHRVAQQTPFSKASHEMPNSPTVQREGLLGSDTRKANSPLTKPKSLQAAKRHPVECIVVGISTGGPAALVQVFTNLAADITVPIVVVQHMPAGFTKPLADRLNSICPLNVVEASDQLALAKATIAIGMAGQQLRVRRVSAKIILEVSPTQGESLYTPSADVLFRSVAEVYGRSSVAFIMTGMGNDGTEGLKLMKKAGAYIYGQDEASSVVYGMPRAAALAGIVDTVIPLSSVADAISAAARGQVV